MYSERTVKQILTDVRTGALSVEEAYRKVKNLPYENFTFARIDHHRHMRTRVPEVIYAPGKTVAQMKTISHGVKRSGHPLLITRLEPAQYKRLKKMCSFVTYVPASKIAYYVPKDMRTRSTDTAGVVAVVTGGTSDIPVAEEAAVTLEIMGRKVVRAYDCGVAGVHRLFDVLPLLQKAAVIICIAGMEGALASVVAGLVCKPIIAVPTSVGYGASFKGIAALLTMLNSCAPGVTVVNIDNGFGAGCAALLMTEKAV